MHLQVRHISNALDGQCSLVSLVELLGLRGVSNFAIVAIDPNASRRKKAEAILTALGAVPGGVIRVVSSDDAIEVSNELSGSYGCDAVLEVSHFVHGSGRSIRLTNLRWLEIIQPSSWPTT